MGATFTTRQFLAEEQIQTPKEPSCSTTSDIDEDEMSSVLRPVKARQPRRRRRRRPFFNQRRLQLPIVDLAEGESDHDEAIAHPDVPVHAHADGSPEPPGGDADGPDDPPEDPVVEPPAAVGAAAAAAANPNDAPPQPPPQQQQISINSLLSRLHRFKVKAEDNKFGHARTFKLIVDNSRRRRNWKRHLSGNVLMSAVFERSYMVGIPMGGKYNLFKHHNKKKFPIGHIVCAGWIDGSINFYDAQSRQQGRMTFASGYAGTLMRLKVRLPRREPLEQDLIADAISAATGGEVLYDVCHYIAGFLAPKDVWKDVPKKVFAGYDVAEGAERPEYDSFVNKTPEWNEDIRAYTLEFGGRALLPSVHNFQLVRNRKKNPQAAEEDADLTGGRDQIHMQLGKLGTVNRESTYFNCDVHTSLSSFHAFAMAVCVLQRTFIAE